MNLYQEVLSSVVCVDKQINSLKFINLNAKKLSMNIKTVKANAWKFIEKAKENSYDLIFADPPYNLRKFKSNSSYYFCNIKKKFLKKMDGLLWNMEKM